MMLMYAIVKKLEKHNKRLDCLSPLIHSTRNKFQAFLHRLNEGIRFEWIQEEKQEKTIEVDVKLGIKWVYNIQQSLDLANERINLHVILTLLLQNIALGRKTAMITELFCLEGVGNVPTY